MKRTCSWGTLSDLCERLDDISARKQQQTPRNRQRIVRQGSRRCQLFTSDSEEDIVSQRATCHTWSADCMPVKKKKELTNCSKCMFAKTHAK